MKRVDEYDLELRISGILRNGVLFAGVLLSVGWVAAFLGHRTPFSHFHDYAPESLASSLRDAWALGQWGLLCCYAGLIALVFLPALRVLLTAWLFVRNREYRLAAIAGFVLVALLISFSLGIESH